MIGSVSKIAAEIDRCAVEEGFALLLGLLQLRQQIAEGLHFLDWGQRATLRDSVGALLKGMGDEDTSNVFLLRNDGSVGGPTQSSEIEGLSRVRTSRLSHK